LKSLKPFISIYLILISNLLITQVNLCQVQPQHYYKHYSKFNINKISTYIFNNGEADININGNSGFVYPRNLIGHYGSLTSIFQSGFLWGAKINGQIRTGGSAYRSGLTPGRILNHGKAENPNSVSVRVYRVRRDYKTADLTSEALDERKIVLEVYNQYQNDWNEWRGNDGAPFEDIDKDGKYNPSIDIPGIPGADQTLWFVANDLDSNQTKYLYGSLPMGIEMQTTVWGYFNPTPFSNIVFKKYILINKSSTTFNDMYIGIWSDPDLGYASDDAVGCDSLLEVGYIYNYNPTDGTYLPLNPPSVGFALLQGPIVNANTNDNALFLGRSIKGKKNLKMTAFSWIYKNGPYPWHDPQQGNYERGTLFLYNLFQGLLGNGEGHPLELSLGPGTTKFPYSGDPLTKTGFVDGIINFNTTGSTQPGDKRLMVCSGPFNMAPGDTQEVIFAQVAGGTEFSIDHLNAITVMKSYVAKAKFFYNQNKPFANFETINPTVIQLDRKIILSWGEEIEKLERIEKGIYLHKFQGYNVYQLPLYNSKISDGKLIATYDVVDGIGKIFDYEFDPITQSLNKRVKFFGTDSGIKRFIEINKDYLKDQPLANGSSYYFGVTSYSNVNNFEFPSSYETPLLIKKVVPQTRNPGITKTYDYGEEIIPQHVFGNSDAKVSVMIIDPTKLKDCEYEVTFQKVNGVLSFTIKNKTENKVLAVNQTNFSGDYDYYITDGFLVRVKNNSLRPLNESDVYKFSLTKQTYEKNLAKSDVEKINVFPNPYYGVNSQELSKYERIVTFSHLPEKVTIRIFNLAGQQVRKLDKNSTEQFLRWDMLNEDRFLVPSGIYIAYIEMPELGRKKILKLAIIQEEIVPDWFPLGY